MNSRLETCFIWPLLYSPVFSFSSGYPLGFLPCAGLRLLRVLRWFQAFLAPALVQQALPAIIFQALNRLRGSVPFQGQRPSFAQAVDRFGSGSNPAVKRTGLRQSAYFFR